eukprot:maker-scaffold72_size415059-snap-gene-3.19 protein:Tk08677 transcript:maker-scaffold72_size415059-snap-gene-3.19-mRNA-1 annotation:"hypothetical protein DAPPUDRAFT_307693"
MSRLTQIALISASLLIATCTAWEHEGMDFEDDQGEGRIFSSVGGLSLFNNTSTNVGSLLAALLLAILFFVTLAPAFGNLGGGGNGQGQSYGQSSFYARSDRRVYEEDLASQMFQLAEAFKKYEVKDVDCQTYVACEASQTQRHEENGILAKVVYGIMKKLNKFGLKQVERKDKYVASLLKMFQYGDESNRQGKEDACSQQRDKCYNATKKPEYKK